MFSKNRLAAVVLGLLFVVLLVYLFYTPTKGSIVILEDGHGTGFTMDFRGYSERNKCELHLSKGDVLQVEVIRESGTIALTVSGKSGSEPYTGNDLKSGIFTITVSETDDYVFGIMGKKATGKIIVENLGTR